MNDASPAPIFEFFNEIGIISQLSSALFSRTLPDGLHVSHFSILNHMVRLGDGRTMTVDQQLSTVGVDGLGKTGQMNLTHRRQRQAANIVMGVQTMVDARC